MDDVFFRCCLGVDVGVFFHCVGGASSSLFGGDEFEDFF